MLKKFQQWQGLQLANKSKQGSLVWLWLSSIVMIIDQITKIWISSILELHQTINVLPFFDLRLLHNPGAAWSILATAGGWQRWFLSILALLVSGILIIWLRNLERQRYWLACALALILGGALGNVTDRILYGYVIDFVDIYYQGWHWPAFNVADSAISVGAVMLLISLVRNEKF